MHISLDSKNIKKFLVSVLFGFIVSPAFAANYSYNIINTPTGFDNSAQGINNLNTIIGTHQSSSYEKSAWLYENGTYANLPSAGNCSLTTNGVVTTKNIELLPLAINNSNEIVGQKSVCGKRSGFKLSNGTYQTIQRSTIGSTRINGINNNGIMVGRHDNANTQPFHFRYNGLTYTQLSFPANAINDKNYIVGGSYIYDSLAYKNTKVTLATAQAIELTALNNVGQTVGISFNNNGNSRKGFVYDSNGFTVIDYPGSLWTIVTGINDQGVVTGWVSFVENFDVNGLYIGGNFAFTATPDVAPDPNGTLPLPVDEISPSIEFDAPIDIEFSAQSLGARLTGDFNSDGSDDLIIAHTVSQKLTIYFGQSAENDIFNDANEIGKLGLASIGYVSSLAKADFDEDGLMDVVVGSRQCDNDNRSFMVARSVGDGNFTTGACLMITNFTGYFDSFVYSIAVNDFNEDTHQDIVVSRTGNYGAKQILLYLGNGDMTFSAAIVIYDGSAGGRPYTIAAGDINNDGHIDLLVERNKYTYLSSTVVHFGDGSGEFPTAQAYHGEWPTQYPDMNNDSYPDNLVSIDSKTLIYFGNSSGDFNYLPQIHPFASSFFTGDDNKISGDFNGDGQSDLLVTKRVAGENLLGKVYYQTALTNTNPDPTPDPGVNQGEQIDFKGTISVVNSGTIVVDGINVIYTDTTLINHEDGTGGVFAIGQSVDIQGYYNSNGDLDAFEIGVSL